MGHIRPGSAAHLVCFNITELEQQLAMALDIPLYGSPHRLHYWGSKSGSRELFRATGLPMLAGFEHLSDMESVAHALQERGVLGRFGVDFVSVQEPGGWRHYAIEVNLRKGGTTHPYLMLQFLTDGVYDHPTGTFRMPNGEARYYVATDGLQSEAYKRWTPEDLIDVAICHQLHVDATIQEGVAFHLLGAVSEYGKLGMVAIGSSPERAGMFYDKAIAVLDAAAAG